MALKTYNPVTSAQRQLVLIDRTGLHAGKPVKALTQGKKSTGGRNNHGLITSRYRGGGHKQAYRKIDFKRRKFDVPARSNGSNTIRIAPASSRWSNMKTANLLTFWRRSGFRRVTL